MNKIATFSLITALLGAMVSCNMEGADMTGQYSKYDMYEPYVSHVISVSELQDSSPTDRALVDLGLPGYGYWVEPWVDHTDVDIICPNGRSMTLQQEIEEIGMSPAQREDGIFIYRPVDDTDVEIKKAPVCGDGCYAVFEPQTHSWHCTC